MGVGVGTQRGRDLPLRIEGPPRHRGDEDRPRARPPRLVDVTAQVALVVGCGIGGALPLARAVVVAELDEDVVAPPREGLVPSTCAPVALRAGPAAGEVDDLDPLHETGAEHLAPTRAIRAGRVVLDRRVAHEDEAQGGRGSRGVLGEGAHGAGDQ